MASTIVTVLPVPGGPNTKYGAGLDVPATMWHTALYCSGFLWSCWSKNLETHTLCSNTHNVIFWSFNNILIGVLLTSVQVETQGSSSLSLRGTAHLWACVGPPCVLLCVAVLTGDDSLWTPHGISSYLYIHAQGTLTNTKNMLDQTSINDFFDWLHHMHFFRMYSFFIPSREAQFDPIQFHFVDVALVFGHSWEIDLLTLGEKQVISPQDWWPILRNTREL